MKNFKKIFLLFRILIGLVILVLAIHFFDFKTVWSRISEANLHFVFFVFVFSMITIVLTSVKLFVCLGYITKISFSNVLFAILNGKIFGYFAPGTLGADISVALSLKSSKSSIFSVGSIMLVDRVLSLVSIILLMLLLLPFSFKRMPIPVQHFFTYLLLSGVVIAVILSAIYFLKPAFIRKVLSGKLQSLSSHPLTRIPALVVHNWGRSLLVILLGLLLNICIQCGTWFLLQTVHLKVDLLYTLGVLPLNSFLVMVPVSIMGIGLREGGFYYLLSVFSVTMEDVIAFNMIGYLFEIIIIMISGSTLLIKAITNLILKKV
jgi:uncharacterized membrane protein YbhN (UPF0104 family)